MITYLHHYPIGEKIGEKWFHEPMSMDYSNCGCYSDRIYNMHSATKRFYIATFGYEKGWKEHNTYDRITGRFTLHFVFEGKGTFNGTPVHAGQMFIAPQNEPYTIIQDKNNPMTFAWIGFSGTELENQINLLHLSEMPRIVGFQNVEAIRTIFIDTVYGKHSEEDIEMLLFSAYYKIMSLCNIVTKPSAKNNESRTDSYFDEIMAYIDTHYAENINVRDIAHHVHISESHLRHICMEVSSQSPQELIAQKRFNVAKSMLSNTDASIEEIALFVGFSSQSALSKFFTKKSGISPQAYRLKKQEERQHNAENITHTENNWWKDEERRLQKIREQQDGKF